MTSEPLHRTIADALEYLRTLVRDDVKPRDAEQQFRSLQTRYPAAKLQLVWDEEVFDGSIAYDVLLRLDDGATLSIALCAERGLAWPLRGVKRWSERDLVRVNGQLLAVDDAILFLDCVWNEAPIMNRLLHSCLVREELACQPIEIEDGELQAGLDAFRRQLGLVAADDMRQWMRQRGLTDTQLESLIEDNLRVARLRERCVGGRVAAYFEAHHRDFDTAEVAKLECADETLAHRIHRQIVSGQASFWEAAERHAVKLTVETVRFRECPVERRRTFFEATAGDVVAPMPSASGYSVARVMRLTPARLDEATAAAIQRLLFDEWLAERRRAARIEWYWGRANHATCP
jgi:putative peptide maturation system protein